MRVVLLVKPVGKKILFVSDTISVLTPAARSNQEKNRGLFSTDSRFWFLDLNFIIITLHQFLQVESCPHLTHGASEGQRSTLSDTLSDMFVKHQISCDICCLIKVQVN